MQLRDAQTSELLAEGTPLEIATVAEQFSKDDVLFDDATPGFDPAAVRKYRADEIAGLESALLDLPSSDLDDEGKRVREGMTSTLADRRDRITAGQAMVADARRRLEEARSRR